MKKNAVIFLLLFLAFVCAVPSVSLAESVAFSVNKNGSNQTVSSGVWTKLTWSTEVFDTNNNFAGDKYTPTIAGYYLFSSRVACNSSSACYTGIYKNGTRETASGENASSFLQPHVAQLLYMNGTTDYVEAWAYTESTAISGTTNQTNFAGFLTYYATSTATSTASTVDNPALDYFMGIVLMLIIAGVVVYTIWR